VKVRAILDATHGSRASLELLAGDRPVTAVHPARDAIFQALSFDPVFNPRVEHQRPAQWLTKSNTFPIGFLDTVVRVLVERNIEFEIINGPGFDEEWGGPPTALDLRDYQHAAAEAVLRNKIGIIRIPTGGGKTILAAALFDRVRKALPGARCLFVAPDATIMAQTAETLEEIFPDEVGVVWEEGKDYDATIIVAVIDSLKIRCKDILRTGQPMIMVVDECHTFGASKGYNTLQKFSAPIRVGLSATPDCEVDQEPDKIRNSRIKGNLGNVAYEVNVHWLKEKGFLETPEVVLMPGQRPAKPPFRQIGIDYYVRKNANRNRSIAYVAEALVSRESRVMVATNTTSQMESIVETLLERGVRHHVIHGGVKGKARTDVLREFGEGAPSVIVGTVLGTGVNVPSTNAMVVADGGSVKNAGIQRLGRILRKKTGGPVLMVDFWDPYWGNRSRAFEQEGWEVTDLRDLSLHDALTRLMEIESEQRNNREQEAV